jgi:Ca2+-binding RTX toxin-like protein
VLNVEFAAPHGGPGDDQLTSRRFLFGEAGNDTLTHVGALRAEMEGGDGRDRMVDRGTGGAAMGGGAGNDVLIAGSGSAGNFMTGGGGNDTIIGGPARDFINGDDGNDQLEGRLGDDVLNGNAGDDRYVAEVGLDGNDTFVGGDGIDTTDYQKRDNLSRSTVLSLSAGGIAGNDGEPDEHDTMTAENIRGGLGRNVIQGDAGRNQLLGGPSADLINSIDGIGHNDVIVGGLGNDVCRFDAGPPPDDVRC